MPFVQQFMHMMPEVSPPSQKWLSFKEKLKWTLIILAAFFILGMIPLFGLGPSSLQRFELLSVILGAEFGSIISLGIGPIVTASIVLQLLNGAGIVKFDTHSPEGRKNFQGTQKLLTIFFIFFEGAIYVLMGGLSPPPELAGTGAFLTLQFVLILQMALGGVLIMFMDEVTSKWGFGSGISLFIAAGVAKSLFIRILSPFPSEGSEVATGVIPALIQSVSSSAPPTEILILLSGVIATVLVFCVAVYVQAMRVEIPLSFGRIRGHGIRWPLAFAYTSNIPVILVAALIANITLIGTLIKGKLPALSSLITTLFSPPAILQAMIKGNISLTMFGQAAFYIIFMTVGCVIFGMFWVQTAGMDSRSQAKQIMNAGLQIPGFRNDPRIMEHVLDRYIGPLTIMGSIAIGLLAALADLSGALTSGTGLLLTVMIVYRLYQDIAKQHMYDMHPTMRKFME